MDPDIEPATQAEFRSGDECKNPHIHRITVILSGNLQIVRYPSTSTARTGTAQPSRSPSRSSSIRAHKFHSRQISETPPAHRTPPSSINIQPASNVDPPSNGTPPAPRSIRDSLEIGTLPDNNTKTASTPDHAWFQSSNFKEAKAQRLNRTPTPTSSSTKFGQPSNALNKSQQVQAGQNVDAELERILNLPFHNRAVEVFDRDIVYKKEDVLTVNFATLYRMRLHRLQSQIIKDVFEMRYHDPSNWSWEEPLKEYGKS